jgi:hypothetical protein
MDSTNTFAASRLIFGFWDRPPRSRKNHWFPDVRLQYAQLRKRCRGETVHFLYSIERLGSRQLIRAGLKALSFSGIVQTAFVERANLVCGCLSVRELLQLPMPEGVWLHTFPAMKGCQ